MTEEHSDLALDTLSDCIQARVFLVDTAQRTDDMAEADLPGDLSSSGWRSRRQQGGERGTLQI